MPKYYPPGSGEPERTPPPPQSLLKYFLDARDEAERMYGGLDINDMLYAMNRRTKFRLIETLPLYSNSHANNSIGGIESIYGVQVVNDDNLEDDECVLLSGEHQYHFTLPPKYIDRKPKSDSEITPMTKYPPSEDMGAPYRGSNPFVGIINIILRFIDWLNNWVTSEPEYTISLVQEMKGVQVKYWHDRLFFVNSVVDFDENNKPILGQTLVVSRYDDNGDWFEPDGLFEVRNKRGKIRGHPYEWQPITGAEKPKAKTNGEKMATLDELFEGHEDGLPHAIIPPINKEQHYEQTKRKRPPRPGKPPGNTSSPRRPKAPPPQPTFKI